VPKKDGAEAVKVDRLAIGVPGGFAGESEHEIIRDHSICLFHENEVTFFEMCDDGIPEVVKTSAAAIVGHDSMCQQTSVETWEEQRKVSKYAQGLRLLPCTRKIPMDPEAWKCDETGATENLWLNLGTGHIGSGRPQWDGTGGNGAALRHYKETGKKFPLVVKLGTITPSGADVYSYASDEDDMVLDPWLGDHLSHWGINMMKMEKTDKSMTELQIERNINFEFDAITESGCALTPMHGKG
jgi:ubiquitin carboxyl-terminal hydrolase 5/13